MMTILVFMIMFAYTLVPSAAIDSISVSQSLSDGKTLVSKSGEFELGFFSPGQSKKRYLGIWYNENNSNGFVWVANRDSPINNTSGILTVINTGNLVLSQNDSVVWSTTSAKYAQNPLAELLDSGNLVIRNEGATNPEAYLWQSFDYPTDSILPGMKLGWDLRAGFERRITSWKSPEDPSAGDTSMGLVLNNYPEFYLMKGAAKSYRIGPWNGLHFSGLSDRKTNQIYDLKFVVSNNLRYASNKDEMFYTLTMKNSSILVRAHIEQSSFSIIIWSEQRQSWMTYEIRPRDQCDVYGICGPFAFCQIETVPMCRCLTGFIPKSPQAWNSSDWSDGCVRNKSLSCWTDEGRVEDIFVKHIGMKVPATTNTLLNENIGLNECRLNCLSNCSCTAYSSSDITGGGRGCVMWFGDLIDMTQFDDGGQDLYIRLSGSLSEPGHNTRIPIIISTTVAAAVSGMLLVCIFAIYRVRRKVAENSKTKENIERYLDDLDLPLFDLLTITTATNNFSLNNKIGQGGFGLVYKGKLADGQEIAVKRLSSSSGQGITEFLTEVKLIAKLQHRNLVKLLGCCIGGNEKLLVYEFLVNGSLDSFIFDQIKGELLEWPRRLQIIFGIARGLMYLHQDSRLRIIHRDLKASNVLLDDNLNPKISDFGMARSFGGDQTEGNTNRVVGTYGYMAPEYASDGLFSIKSDVFSFGILLLEIISGNKNRALCHGNQTLNLVGYAWTLWKEGKTSLLIDSRIKDSYVVSELLRCFHVSLLCVQQYPEDRPTMTSVVLMLSSEMELVEPKEPGFFPRAVSDDGNVCSNPSNMSSNDELTITSLNGSGMASLLLPGGRTTHSKFCIPLDAIETSTCNIKQGSLRAKLLLETSLIIWDEAPMLKKYCFEALDVTLRDLMRSKNEDNAHKPFGGKVVILGGDFRQILPVITRGSRQEIVESTVNSSSLWKHCKVMKLTKNMRLTAAETADEAKEIKDFADWILKIGNGDHPDSGAGEYEVQIPPDLLIPNSPDPLMELIRYTYPDLAHKMKDPQFFQDRAILAPTLEAVEMINTYMLGMIAAPEHEYLSSDSALRSDEDSEIQGEWFTTEFLNDTKSSGMPNHKLLLKVGTPIMLLRNIDQAASLCNGTRLIVDELGERFIGATVITGTNVSDKVHILRMDLVPSDSKFPIKFRRRQFPIAICFAMTINKSQGQTLSQVGLFLPRPVFTHGQLYVALSRVRSRKGLKLCILDEAGKQQTSTVNVVFKEVFGNV